MTPTPNPNPALRIVTRHRVATRVWHWVNLVAVAVMLMSGLMISNAHPRLYWGRFGANPDRAWLELPQFPGWMTIPSHYSLADARVWHLAFAWVILGGTALYLGWALTSGHLRRNILPSSAELAQRHVWQDLRDHAALRFPKGEAALHYGVLQKLAYALVLVVLLPLVVLTGLALSPALNAAWHGLPELFGGRQSARSIHFLCAAGLVAFFVVHIVMVMLVGPANAVRAMITGRYRVPQP